MRGAVATRIPEKANVSTNVYRGFSKMPELYDRCVKRHYIFFITSNLLLFISL